jgi:RNA polymerase sigma-70 factor (ECF subfamily)
MTEIDRQDFDSAILEYSDELYGTAVRLTRDPNDAEDLVQEAIMRAWAFWDRFRAGTNGRAWIHRILMNTFINGYRRKKREREIMGQVQVQVRDQPRWAHDDDGRRREGLSDQVEAALAALPEEFRTVVLLVDGNGLSYKEAADALDCPIGTVMSRLHRARKRLQADLRAYAMEEGYVEAA